LVATLRPRPALGDRTPQHAAPPQESIAQGGRGGGGGKRHPAGVPAALACSGDNATAIVIATIAGPLLPVDAANAGTVDVLGWQSSPPLAVTPLLLRQLLLLLQLPWGVDVCVSAHHPCRCHCHGGNLAVIVATSVAAAVGEGRTCMVAS
jgi:hypothetical protein